MSLTSPILASSVPTTSVPLNFDASIWSCVCLATNFGESAALVVDAPGAAAAGGSEGVVVGDGDWARAVVSARPLTAAAAMSLLIMSGLRLGNCPILPCRDNSAAGPAFLAVRRFSPMKTTEADAVPDVRQPFLKFIGC